MLFLVWFFFSLSLSGINFLWIQGWHQAVCVVAVVIVVVVVVVMGGEGASMTASSGCHASAARSSESEVR
jgi:Tfp pilus assembly protein PilO